MNGLFDYRWSDVPRLLGLGLLYALLVGFVFGYLTTPGHVAMVWIPSGLGLAALLAGGKKLWPAIFFGALVGYAVMLDRSLWVSAGIALGSNTLESVACVYGLSKASFRGQRFSPALRHPVDYVLLGLVGGASAGLAALVGCWLMWLDALLPRQALVGTLLHWWMGNFLGLVVVAPLFLVWRKFPRGWFKRERMVETAACFGLTLLAGQAVFLGWLHGFAAIGLVARGHWAFLFVAWAAVRFGRHGALLVVGMTAVQALLGAIQGSGFFASDIADTGLVGFWFYMLALTTIGITLALVIEQRDRVEDALRASEARFRSMNDFLPQQIWTALPDGNLDFVNRRVLDFFRQPREAILAAGWQAYVHPDDLPGCLARWAESLRTGQPYEFDFRLLHHSGVYQWCFARAEALRDEEGAIVKWYGSNTDITERKRAEEEMQLVSLVYQNSSEGMMVTDASGTILSINPAFTEMTGFSLEDVVGKTPNILYSGYQDEAFYQAMWQQIVATGQWQGEIWDRRKDGEVFAEWLSINTSYNDDGSVHRRIALFSDITEKKKTEALIWRQANYDSLTGLPNRQMFHDRLQQEIKKAHRAGLSMALLFLDLDRFKEVNDTLGHDMGDILLKDAARRLSRCVRETDTVARLGGDEFTVILGELQDTACVERIAGELLRKLAQPFRLGGELAYVSVSIGITFCPADAASADALIKSADQAMYAAKSQGRNRFSYFTLALQEAAQIRVRLANDLRGALEAKQFRLVFQPIVELLTGDIRKAEVLIRWDHPTRGLVNPAEFIPIAEDTGAIIAIGHWLFREAAQQAARWRQSLCADFQVSVNKSPAQFRDAGHTHVDWFAYLRELGLPGQAVMVEITEGLLLEAGANITDQLLEFRDAGLQVAIDDFGAGYSSLSCLRKFDIDYLKIDQSFVQFLEPASEELVLCEAIIAMAHKLGIKVIAEGVETAGQRDLLTAAGCDYAQGYFFSRPVSAEAFEQLFEARDKPAL